MPAACANLTKQNWSNSLPFQQFQALFTIFQSPLHLSFIELVRLSASKTYVKLQMKFTTHFAAPLPRNVTLRVNTVRAGLQMTDRTLTWRRVTFSKELASAPTLVLHHVITCQGWKAWISHAEPYPNSFAIAKGILFSFFFTPLTYMLKLRQVL